MNHWILSGFSSSAQIMGQHKPLNRPAAPGRGFGTRGKSSFCSPLTIATFVLQSSLPGAFINEREWERGECLTLQSFNTLLQVTYFSWDVSVFWPRAALAWVFHTVEQGGRGSITRLLLLTDARSPGHGARWNREVVAGLPRARLASYPMQEPATCKPAREEVKAGGAGALQTAAYCQGLGGERWLHGSSADCKARFSPVAGKPDGGRLRDAYASLESPTAQC